MKDLLRIFGLGGAVPARAQNPKPKSGGADKGQRRQTNGAKPSTPTSKPSPSKPASSKEATGGSPVMPRLKTPRNLPRYTEWTEELQAIVKSSGALLTAEGKPLEQALESRAFVAMYESGLFLVAETDVEKPEVRHLRQMSHIHKHLFTGAVREVRVSREIIGRAYGLTTRNTATTARLGTRSTSEEEKLYRRIIEDAARQGVADVHITTEGDSAKVEFRIDSIIEKVRVLGRDDALNMMAAAYYAAQADRSTSDPDYKLNSRQSASIRTGLPSNLLATRLQWNPLGGNGRWLDTRLLYGQTGERKTLNDAGYLPPQIETLKLIRMTPYGMIIFSGPVGSGKSTTASIMLEDIYEETNGAVNIATIEDPIEYPIKGAKQTFISNNADGMDRDEQMVEAIKALLRSDTNIVLIGEQRDAQSIIMSLRAAMTGQQVYTTLHANRAIGIIPRLRNQLTDANASPVDLYDTTTMIGLVNQRLMRTLCPHCRIPLREWRKRGTMNPLHEQQLMSVFDLNADGLFVANADGCEKCRRGYKGRSVVAEIIRPDNEFMELMVKHDLARALNYWEDRGGISLDAHGLTKVATGQTSYEEFLRVIGPISRPSGPAFAQLQEQYFPATGIDGDGLANAYPSPAPIDGLEGLEGI